MSEQDKRGFRIVAAGRVADVFLYEEIGPGGITSDEFRQRLDGAGDVDLIRLYVDSPGGSITHGWAIHSLLMRHPARVNATIDGLCASMATLIVCAADRIEMHEGALFMIHSPYDANAGEGGSDAETMNLLGQIKETMISAYAHRTGLSPLKLRNMLTPEGVWMTAAEARKMGFVDSVIPLRVAACAWNLEALGLKPPVLPDAAPAIEDDHEKDYRELIANYKLDQLKSRGIIRTPTGTK